MGAQRAQRTVPPTVSDWGGAQCVWRTRFSVTQIYLPLDGLDMFRPDGSSKTYRVYQSDKLYWKRGLNGRFNMSQVTLSRTGPCHERVLSYV